MVEIVIVKKVAIVKLKNSRYYLASLHPIVVVPGALQLPPDRCYYTPAIRCAVQRGPCSQEMKMFA